MGAIVQDSSVCRKHHMQGHQHDQDEEKLRYKFDKSKGQKGDVNWNIRQKNESNYDVAKGVKKIHLRLYLSLIHI